MANQRIKLKETQLPLDVAQHYFLSKLFPSIDYCAGKVAILLYEIKLLFTYLLTTVVFASSAVFHVHRTH